VRAGLGTSLSRDQDVGGLDVTVHESLVVCGVEGRGDLADDPSRLDRVEGPLLTQEGS
jgi:hypothetical protein